MPAFPIVKRKFTADEFDAYMATVPIGSWTKRIVLHNTAVPSLKSWKGVVSESNLEALHKYYEFRAPAGKKGRPTGWPGGPHLFIDSEGIWVFNPLDKKGVHSPSFNRDAWGIEMLGDYASEAFDSGHGLAVQNNAIRALAAMFRRLGVKTLDGDNFKIHKEDPKTTHDCPGKNVHKPAVQAQIQALLGGAPPVAPPVDGVPTKVVVYRKDGGPDPSAVVPGVIRNGTTFVDAKKISAATGLPTTETGEIKLGKFVKAKFAVNWDATTGKVYIAELA